MSFVLLGILNSQASGGGFSYRFQVIGSNSTFVQGRAINLDSNDNIYTAGAQGVSSPDKDSLLVQYDNLGVLQWQKYLQGSIFENWKGIAFDSLNNPYVIGETNSLGDNSNRFLLAKYDTSGNVQWQRILTGSVFETPNSIAIDSNDDVYVFGHAYINATVETDWILAKYNSSGTIQWQRTLSGLGGVEEGYSIAIDSNNNVYATGFTNSSGAGKADFLIAKYNSSGTLQWQRTLGGGETDVAFAVTVDASDNIYVLGETRNVGGSDDDFLLAKYDTSGNVQWQRFVGSSSFDEASSVVTDSLGNIYIFGQSSSSPSAGSDDYFIAKYNSSGTIQWQRRIGTSGTEEAYSISVDSSDNIYLLGDSNSFFGSGQTDMLIGVIPNDGSLTGTYDLDGVDVVYQASSFTTGTASLTNSAATLSSSISSLTDSSSSFSAGSVLLITEQVNL